MAREWIQLRRVIPQEEGESDGRERVGVVVVCRVCEDHLAVRCELVGRKTRAVESSGIEDGVVTMQGQRGRWRRALSTLTCVNCRVGDGEGCCCCILVMLDSSVTVEHDQMSSLDMTVASGCVDRMMQMGMCV